MPSWSNTCSSSCTSLPSEHVHQCRQAPGGGRAAGPDGRVRPGGDLPGCPPARRPDPGLRSPRGAAQSPPGHVCRLPHARQRGGQGGWVGGDVTLERMVGCVLVWMRALHRHIQHWGLITDNIKCSADFYSYSKHSNSNICQTGGVLFGLEWEHLRATFRWVHLK